MALLGCESLNVWAAAMFLAEHVHQLLRRGHSSASTAGSSMTTIPERVHCKGSALASQGLPVHVLFIASNDR